MISDLLKGTKNGRVSKMLDLDRKALIFTASEILETDHNLTIILANNQGDLVVMSRKEDCVSIIRDITKKSGGSG